MRITINQPVTVEFDKIYLTVYPRYFEDCDVCLFEEDWKECDSKEPEIPCVESIDGELAWVPIIDINNGHIINWKKGIKARTYWKVCDRFEVTIIDKNGNEFCHYDGYVPDFADIDDEGYGDYVFMTIDEDGYINNWEFTPKDAYSLMEYNKYLNN